MEDANSISFCPRAEIEPEIAAATATEAAVTEELLPEEPASQSTASVVASPAEDAETVNTPRIQQEPTEGDIYNEKLPRETAEETHRIARFSAQTTATAISSAIVFGSATRPGILSLTHDSLHCIASFLTPLDWCSFGQANKAASKLCNETIRHVCLHGFRCAQEVVTAWKLGQHEDAKELAALYVSNGVPIYPRTLGHSYHTILWRMGVEVKEIVRLESMSEEDTEPTADASPESPPTSSVDAFYRERIHFRVGQGYNPNISYLTEKSLFWMDKKENEDEPTSGRRQNALTNSQIRSARLRAIPPNQSPSNTLNKLPQKDFRRKLPIKLHQHLLQQHLLERSFVKDHEGTMITPSICLSADFFHPVSWKHRVGPLSDKITLPEHATPEMNHDDHRENNNHVSHNLRVPNPYRLAQGVTRRLDAAAASAAADDNVGLDDDDDDGAFNELDRALGLAMDNLLDAQDFIDEQDDEPSLEWRNTIPRTRLNDVLSRVDLEIYSSSWTTSSKKDDAEGVLEMKRHMRSRFTTYQRRLETFLLQKDHASFDECLMDFWDEFFPHSAGIHYFDRHTVVPRVSSLVKFLTKPVPKALGTIQCEIERIKINTKGKGAGMKGRLFPTYEYRLFIRHRPNQGIDSAGSADEEDCGPRRDTVLMVAKNRGRKHTEASVMPMSAAARKGSNNYYLYLPQQNDVDDHYNEVNEPERPTRLCPNGASQRPIILSNTWNSSLLGRLQSNFIGTEFQIFTPHTRKRSKMMAEHSTFAPCSEDEIESDGGFSSDNNSTATRRSRFGRMSLRRNASNSIPSVDNALPVISDANMVSPARGRSPTVTKDRAFTRHTRSSSCPDVLQPRQTRTSRRVANTPDWKAECKKTYIVEEEDGCITYTANLLGSRPRIMDVCIPKVHPESSQRADWERYLKSSDELDEFKMLNCFRQILQRLENPEQPLTPAPEEVIRDNESDHEVYTAPDDFGLMPLQNRPPWWNIELGSFVLNFGGRVSVASVKNFQLCERNDQDKILLQFGRIQGRHSFTMDFQHPLTAVQAFSIAISSLQSKISFG